jgi:hypothetical protein
MKNRKWLTYTLGILLTLLVIAGVGMAGFRMGVMQSAKLVRNADGTKEQIQPFGHMRGFENKINNQPGGNPRMMQGFDQGGFGRGGFERGRGGRHFFSPIFSLIHIALLGLLLWFGFKLVKNSGWRLTRTPAASETPKVEAEEKKE